MKHTVVSTLNITFVDYDNLNQNGKSSHVFLIKHLQDECLKKGKRRREVEVLINNIYDLKERRRKADYDNVIITSDDSSDALDLSQNLQTEIKKIFQV